MSDNPKKVLDLKWYVVDQPWGDGSWIRAGAPDAAGEFVCDCEGLLDHCDFERQESATEIAEHIVRLHNWYLERRRSRDSPTPPKYIDISQASVLALQPGVRLYMQADNIKAVARIGLADDWAVYWTWEPDWDLDRVADYGLKMSEDKALAFFPVCQEAGLSYRL